uniref:ribonuclease M5 n=1 Tax=Ndongobacter massiliensis TaxID=1871025 RepID=UPI000931F14C|nr:ribonuclease M5 [Ndongobacter massiliensis]
MIREIIVVEGKDDVAAVRRAIDCECVVTHGHGFGEELLERLAVLQERRGLIVLTDPDYAGGRIRARIRAHIPNARHAHIARSDAQKGDNIGVENADPEAIRTAILHAHATLIDRRTEFSSEDLFAAGLDAAPGAKERRIALGEALGIGYANAKQLLARLNEYDISREEFERAMTRILSLEKEKLRCSGNKTSEAMPIGGKESDHV